MIGLLISGGMDSAAIAYMHKPDIAFNINYGQRPAKAERRAAQAICNDLGIKLVNIDIDCSTLGSGDLVESPPLSLAPETDWWPFRNQLIITLCAIKAVEHGCTSILIGTVKSDQCHADGSPEFIENINRLIFSQEGGLSIHAPAMDISTTELIQKSGIPFSILAWSHSCHKSNLPCTNCRGCNKHFSTLRELGHYE